MGVSGVRQAKQAATSLIFGGWFEQHVHTRSAGKHAERRFLFREPIHVAQTNGQTVTDSPSDH